MLRCIRVWVRARAPALLACLVPFGASAAMTLDQMKSLKGTAQLEMPVDKLFRRCGLPAAISDHGSAAAAKQSLGWDGTVMRLSAMDWSVAYRTPQAPKAKAEDWINTGELNTRCLDGLAQWVLHAKGNVGTLTVTRKAQGYGYATSYRVPRNLYKAHKVVGIRATLGKGHPVATLVARYGQPDEVVKQAGAKERFRYWVLTRRNHRPELLYAVDFEIDAGESASYSVSSSDVEFVQQRLEMLLRQWERDYVLD